MNLEQHFYWFEVYDGHEFQLNCYVLLRFAMTYHPNELVYSNGPQARAWQAYYNTLRDDPESNDDQRQRAKDMLRKFPLPEQYQIRPEDLA